MFRKLQLILVPLAILAGPARAQETSEWIFEGLITEADPALAPDLQSGWVLAGSFALTPLAFEEEPVEAGARAGRLSGGVDKAEFTIDLYYQLHFEASQVPGMAGFDYQDNDPGHDGRDLLGWFIPMRGNLKESGWSSRWLQVWLSDPEGKMIRSVPPAISPYGINWKHGWFRITFEKDSGETAFADGRMEYFGPPGSGEADDATAWKDAATRLSAILSERDAEIRSLRNELEETKARMDGLRRMVDLLVQERSHLQQENALLEEKARQADPKLTATIADLSAEKALLEEQISGLSGRNHALAESLASSELERLKLLDLIADMEARAGDGAQRIQAPRTAEAPVMYEGKPVGTMTIIERPMIIEKPVPPPQFVPDPPPVARAREVPPSPEEPEIQAQPKPQPAVEPAMAEAESSASPQPRRRGPRKFR